MQGCEEKIVSKTDPHPVADKLIASKLVASILLADKLIVSKLVASILLADRLIASKLVASRPGRN
mgnify:CR=1 FL=1